MFFIENVVVKSSVYVYTELFLLLYKKYYFLYKTQVPFSNKGIACLYLTSFSSPDITFLIVTFSLRPIFGCSRTIVSTTCCS